MTKRAGNSCIHVTLKEFVESLIEAQDKVTDAKFESAEQALKLQADEYKRRLTELNHAHEIAQARNAEFIRIDKFESFEREFREYKESNNKAVNTTAKAAADAVDQKAEALKKEFLEYKATTERATNLAAGQRIVADPQMADFIREMKAMSTNYTTALNQSKGKAAGFSSIGVIITSVIGVLAGGMFALSSLVNILMALYIWFKPH